MSACTNRYIGSAFMAVLVALFCQCVQAQEGDAKLAADRAAMQAVISQQLRAIQADDEPGAFAFNTDALQQHFHTPAKFMQMVRAHFDALYRAKSPEFIDVGTMQAKPDLHVQGLKLTGPEGHVWIAIYKLEQNKAGDWRVARCSLKQMDAFFR